jgi:hypothetical protein
MGITYGLIGTAQKATASEAEWILVPTGHAYIGVVRVCNTDPAAQTFRLAHTAATGAATTPEDWDCYDTPIEVGETIDITMEMAAAESLRIEASKADVISFKFTGMDRANL